MQHIHVNILIHYVDMQLTLHVNIYKMHLYGGLFLSYMQGKLCHQTRKLYQQAR